MCRINSGAPRVVTPTTTPPVRNQGNEQTTPTTNQTTPANGQTTPAEGTGQTTPTEATGHTTPTEGTGQTTATTHTSTDPHPTPAAHHSGGLHWAPMVDLGVTTGASRSDLFGLRARGGAQTHFGSNNQGHLQLYGSTGVRFGSEHGHITNTPFVGGGGHVLYGVMGPLLLEGAAHFEVPFHHGSPSLHLGAEGGVGVGGHVGRLNLRLTGGLGVEGSVGAHSHAPSLYGYGAGKAELDIGSKWIQPFAEARVQGDGHGANFTGVLGVQIPLPGSH